MIGHAATFAWLLAVWVLLRRPAEPTGVVAGALIAAALVAVFRPLPRRSTRGAFRPARALAFALWFGWKLVEANVQVAIAVLWPRRVRETRAVIAMPLVPLSDPAAMVLANAISLTPGTFIVDYRASPPAMFVHVLQYSDLRRARLELMEVQRRVARAFATPEAVAAVEDLVRRIEKDPDGGSRA
jgi:multicomponent Na+:H+ antiporter subunit E